MCWIHQSYHKETVYYINLPCVRAVWSKLVIEFRAFGVRFLSVVVFVSLLTYDRYYSCFDTGTLRDKVFAGIINLQSWTKYLEQSKEIKQNWIGLRNFLICFFISFYSYYQKFIFGRENEPYPLPCKFGLN